MELFKTTFEESVHAMELFAAADLSEKIALFEVGCLTPLILDALRFVPLGESRKLADYLKRLEPILPRYEYYVAAHHKKFAFEIANAYDQYMRHFLGDEHVFTDRNKNFYEKAIKYYKMTLEHQPGNDLIYGGLAVCQTGLGYKEIIDGNKKIGRELHKEAMENFHQIKNLSKRPKGLKDQLEKYMQVVCNCAACVASRESEVEKINK